jgi:molybdenum cofactor guanylyltransferase
MDRVAGIVLCGGKSSRMGRPKAWLPFGPEVLLQRVVCTLSGVVDPVVVVAGQEQELPELPAGVLVARDAEEYLGPLNGLAGGLARLAGQAEIAYLSPCDVPFLRPAFVRRVVERLRLSQVAMPEIGGFQHPLAAAYRVSVLPVVRELLRANRLRPADLAGAVPTTILRERDVADVDPAFESLRNINTPEEYAAALRDAGYAPAGPD